LGYLPAVILKMSPTNNACLFCSYEAYAMVSTKLLVVVAQPKKVFILKIVAFCMNC